MKINITVHSPVGKFVGWIECFKDQAEELTERIDDCINGRIKLSLTLNTDSGAALCIHHNVTAQSVIEIAKGE